MGPESPGYGIDRVEVDGVPVFWGDRPAGLPFIGGVVFRVGRADETLRTSGITHLTEHLALPADTRAGVDFNGTVDTTTTTFWASGDEHDVLELLRRVAATLHSLPFERLERERSILLTEARGRNPGHAGGALGLRYGARGAGLVAHDELGLEWLGREELEAWVADHFTVANCAVYLTGSPPDELDLLLPAGVRRPPADPVPIPYVRYPAAFAHGPDNSVAAAFPAARSMPIMIAMAVLVERVRERLRYGRGVTYDVGGWFEPLTAELAHHTLWADCLPENVSVARGAFLTELDELARVGPTDEERRRDLSESDRAVADRGMLPNALWQFAQMELFGGRFTTPEELRAERAAATRADVAETLGRALEDLLVVVPEGSSSPAGRFYPYPDDSPSRVTGRRLRRAGLPFRREGAEREIHFGDEGVTLVGDGYLRTVTFADTVAVLVWSDDGSRTMCGSDAIRIHLDPAIWRGGDELIRFVDSRVDKDVRVDMGRPDEVLADADVQAAQDAADRGDHERALRLYDTAVQRWPEHAVLRCMRGASLFALSRWSELLAEADRAVALNPELEWAQRLQAYGLWWTGRRQEALAAFHAALELFPSDLAALTDIAWFAAEEGDDADARRAAERAVELYPDEPDAWSAFGSAAQAVGRWDEAERGLRKTVELAPRDSMARNNLGWLLLQTGQPQQALKAFDEALKLDSSNRYALFNRAHALRLLGRWGEAERLRTGRLEADLTSFGPGPSADDRVAATELVSTLDALGRDEDALAAARKAAALHPQHAPLQRRLVVSEFLFGDQEEARAVAARLAEDDDPQSVVTAAWFGWVADDAALATTAAARLDDVDDSNRRRSIAGGYAALADRRWQEAAASFERVLAQMPTDCCSHVALGVALAELGDLRGAEAALEQAHVASAARCQDLPRLRQRLARPA